MPAETRADRSPAAEWISAGLFFAYVVVLFSHSSAPSMTDYANWTYQGVLLKRHLLGQPDAAHLLKRYPVPNSAATLGVGLLALLLPWTVAAKLWLCLQLAVSWAALRAFARATGANAAVWSVAPQALFLGVNWWYGFVNFELGVAWVLLFAAMLLRRAAGSLEKDWPLGLVLIAAFFSHMIPFAFCVLLLCLYAAQTRHSRVLLQAIPSAVLSGWYLGGRYLLAGNADGQAGMAATVRTFSAAFWLYKVNSWTKSFGFVNPGELSGSVTLALLGPMIFGLLFALSATLSVLLAWWIMRSAQQALRGRGSERFLWLGVVSMFPLYLLVPGTALGISDPGSRILQTALAVALVLAFSRHRSVAGALAAGASGILSLAGFSLFVLAGFGSARATSHAGLPHPMIEFAHVPNHDQDSFYAALARQDFSLTVFPTGMLLNVSGQQNGPAIMWNAGPAGLSDGK